MSIPALNAGIKGIHQGLNNMRRDASAIAQAINTDAAGSNNERPVDVAGPLVNLKIDSLQIQASGKVVESVSDIIGSLLDVTA
ncbi:MAG TPA: hypothetical protein ENI97_14660 [Gammaproteobacteria bacterium]|nr:hypothetical protein [Gammaproteobacteria bacterium]